MATVSGVVTVGGVAHPVTASVTLPASGARGGWLLDATNTGVPAGTALTVVNGNLTVAAGQTVTGKDVAGYVVLGAGATLKNSRIRLSTAGDASEMGPGSTFDHCDMGGGTNGTTHINSPYAFWVGGSGSTVSTVQSCNIHHMNDGIRADGALHIYDSWVHDLNFGQDISGVHSDGVQMTQKGTAPVEIGWCRWKGGNNVNIFMQLAGAVNVHHNLLEAETRSTGEATSFHLSLGSPSQVTGPILIQNNRADRTVAFLYNPVATPYTANGNVYSDTLTPIPGF